MRDLPQAENPASPDSFLGKTMGIMGDWMDKHLTFVPVMKKLKIILKISDIKYDMLLPMSSTEKEKRQPAACRRVASSLSDRANALQRETQSVFEVVLRIEETQSVFKVVLRDRGNAKRFRAGTAGSRKREAFSRWYCG